MAISREGHLGRRPRLAAARPAGRGPRGPRGPRIGLLGGSFNPAHEGHLHISRMAIRRLGLDQIWWLVSPGNPLKPARGMAPFAKRLARARALARHPAIRVSDIEARMGTRFTVDTLRALAARFPMVRFVWIMGADNLAQIPRWKDWTAIFAAVPIAIFDRPSYSLRALSGKAVRRFGRYRLPERRGAGLAERAPPAWIFFHERRHWASATRIRAAGRWSARGRTVEAAAHRPGPAKQDTGKSP